MGFAQIGYQVFKLVAHQRLHELAKGWEQRYPGVDIVLIEPEPDDELMFQTSMMSFTSRVEIARHGFESVTKQLAGQYDRYQEVAERHGFEISPSAYARWSSTSTTRRRSQRLAQDPRRDYLRAAAPVRLGRLAVVSTASSSDSTSRPEPTTGSVMRTWPVSPSASPAATTMPRMPSREASSAPGRPG